LLIVVAVLIVLISLVSLSVALFSVFNNNHATPSQSVNNNLGNENKTQNDTHILEVENAVFNPTFSMLSANETPIGWQIINPSVVFIDSDTGHPHYLRIICNTTDCTGGVTQTIFMNSATAVTITLTGWVDLFDAPKKSVSITSQFNYYNTLTFADSTDTHNLKFKLKKDWQQSSSSFTTRNQTNVILTDITILILISGIGDVGFDDIQLQVTG